MCQAIREYTCESIMTGFYGIMPFDPLRLIMQRFSCIGFQKEGVIFICDKRFVAD
jgi:hypothetical protein